MLTSTWAVSLVACIVLVALYKATQATVYYVKWIGFVLLFSLLALVSIPINILKGGRRPDGTNVLGFIPAIRVISWIVGVEWVIEGRERLAKNGGCVVVANHQSALDSLLIAELWPTMRKTSVLVKKSILWVFPFGIGVWLAGYIFIDRSSAASCREGMKEAGQVMTKTGTKIWIFPEGTRSKKGELQVFKRGAFKLALENKVPIIPVVIGPYTFIRDEDKWFGRGRVHVSILPAVETGSYQRKDGTLEIDKLSDNVRDKMNLAFAQLTKQFDPLNCNNNNNNNK